MTNAVALAPGGDLDGSGSLTVGDQVVFTVTVSNAGPDSAPGVQVVDWLGNGVFNNSFTYVGDDSLGTYDGVTGQWVVGTIAPGTDADAPHHRHRHPQPPRALDQHRSGDEHG